jgi:hypothetical protein
MMGTILSFGGRTARRSNPTKLKAKTRPSPRRRKNYWIVGSVEIAEPLIHAEDVDKRIAPCYGIVAS